MRRLLQLSAGALFAASIWTAPCAAQSEPGASGASPPIAPSIGDTVIGEAARRVLHDYYQRNAAAWIAANPDEDGQPEGNSGGNGKKEKHKNNGNNGHNGKRKTLPPGIAKKDTLPPGLAQQLVRNGHLPAGLDYQPLPQPLVAQLPALAPDYRYVIADDRVMLIRAATNTILDVLQVPAL